MLAAVHNADGIIHCAAVLPYAGVTMEESFSTNTVGTLNVLAAAALRGVPVVQVLAGTFFDTTSEPLSERSPLDLSFRHGDAYSVSKRLAYVEGFARVAQGQDIRFVCPGAIYGPSVCATKAMGAGSFNRLLASAIQGRVGAQLPLFVPYVTAADCAFVCIAALDKGMSGERFLAMGRPDEVGTIADHCNRACEIAGANHRVEQISMDKLDSPEVLELFGPTMPALARYGQPTPVFDSRITEARLGYIPTSVEDGFPKVIDWMRARAIL
jgi:nucleoside-diphosphate-sugar epimerase